MTDRLAKAREARFAKNPPKYSQYCKEVVSLPDDHDFSLKNVRAWIKEARAHKAAEHRSHVAGTKGALARRETWNAYISQLESYLRTGAYCSLFAGGDMNKKVSKVCIAMAYHSNGKPKREFGVYYKDYMQVWTPELENEERISYGMKPLKFNDKGYILVNSTSKKTKKKQSNRKPMTEAQKAAFVERMRKAREKKAK
jgi:uncharacterized protein YdhG (YjbR/CyaY superfamily)